MANILYGVNGEGSGHSSRARELITHLEAQGHRVRYRQTVLRNLVHAPRAARSVRALGRKAQGWNLDLVITDFEPISCHVGHNLNLPILVIDNQHLLTDTEMRYPREYRKEALATKLVTRLMTPRADAYLVISFFGARVKKKNTCLFPPILREAVLRATPGNGDYVLVYVTSAATEWTDVLQTVRQRFVCYGFNRAGKEGTSDFGPTRAFRSSAKSSTWASPSWHGR